MKKKMFIPISFKGDKLLEDDGETIIVYKKIAERDLGIPERKIFKYDKK